MRHVEHVMGTAVSFDVRQDAPGDLAVAQGVADAVSWLHQVDEIFSTYRPGSPVSRLGRGEITLAECPPEVSEILHLCEQMADASHGYFSAHPGGRLDPSAMVKGWAVERASHILIAAGAVNHCVNGGGDIQIAGSPGPGQPWRIGIAHPLQPGTLATVVTAEARPASGSPGSALRLHRESSSPSSRASSDMVSGPKTGPDPSSVTYKGSATSAPFIPRVTGSPTRAHTSPALTGLRRTELGRIGLAPTGLGQTGLGPAGPDPVGSTLIGSTLIGSGWAGPWWAGPAPARGREPADRVPAGHGPANRGPANRVKVGGSAGRRRLAIATSGTAERGAHVLNPLTGRPATELASITVVGESLTVVDAYATAAFAMGNAAHDWIEQLEGLEAFAVTATGSTWQTSDFPNT